MSGEICTDSFLISIFLIINRIILIAKIAIPIIIIVVTSFDIIGDITGNKLEFKSSLTKVKYRLIAAILIFLAPTMISAIFRVIDSDYSTNNLECLLHVTKEEYETALNANCAELAEQIKTVTDNKGFVDQSIIDKAYLVCGKLTDKELYDKYSTELNEVVKLREESFNEIWEQQKKEQQAQLEANQDDNRTLPNLELGTSKGGVNFDRPFTGAKMKYYSQGGNYGTIPYEYKGVHYNYNTSGCGCGYVSLAMMIDSLNGSNLYPTGIIRDFIPQEYGSCAILDTTITDYYGKINKDYGLNVRTIFPRSSHEGRQPESMKKERKEKVVEALKQGESVILLIPGHYIVLAAIDTNGKIALHDPSNSNNNGWFTIDEIYDYHEDHASRCSKGRQDTDSKTGKLLYDKNGNPVMYHRCGFIMAIGYKGPNSISSISEYYQVYGTAKDRIKPNDRVTQEVQ